MTTRQPDARLKREVLNSLFDRQRKWAGSALRDTGYPDYTFELAGNLYQQLLQASRNDFEGGSGSELKRRSKGKYPPKSHALKSSAALAINVFDYWRERGLIPLSEALNSPKLLASMQMEAQFNTGLGKPCNLDVALWAADQKWVLAIEAKFTEPFGSGKKAGLKPKYLPKDRDTPWKRLGLEKCDRLARQLEDRSRKFAFLDAPQLLKHIFGLYRKMGNNFQLNYLWYDVSGEAGRIHWEEVEQFAEALKVEVDFHYLTYQSLIDRLKGLSTRPEDADYFDYLKRRYQLG